MRCSRIFLREKIDRRVATTEKRTNAFVKGKMASVVVVMVAVAARMVKMTVGSS